MSVTVTGTITDPSGLAWANAAYAFSFLPGQSSPVPGSSESTASVTGVLDGSGAFTGVSLGNTDNLGGGCQWKCTITGTTGQVWSAIFRVTASTSSLSTTISAFSPVQTVYPLAGTVAANSTRSWSNYTDTNTWGTATGAGTAMSSMTDTANNTGTGAMLKIAPAAGSAAGSAANTGVLTVTPAAQAAAASPAAGGSALTVIAGAGGAQSATTSDGAAGGTITLKGGVGGAGGSSSGSGGAGGAVAVTSGAGAGTITGGTGGALTLAAGAGGSGSTTAGTGGAASLTGGAAVTTVGTAGVGGAASVVGGVGSPNTASAGTAGAGGAAALTGGAGGPASTGAATGGAGGAVAVTGGAGGGTITGGAGGPVTVTGGAGANGSTAGGSGGALTIGSGAAGTGGTGTAGAVTIKQGTTNILATTTAGATTLSSQGTNQDLTLAPSGSGNLVCAAPLKGITRPVIAVAATKTLQASDSGSLVLVGATTGEVVTLPTAAAGLWFDFVITVSNTSNYNEIKTSSGSQFLLGAVDHSATGIAPLTFWADGTTIQAIKMDGAHLGGLIGSRFHVEAVSSTQWEITGVNLGTATMTTAFTATP